MADMMFDALTFCRDALENNLMCEIEQKTMRYS